MTCEVGCPQECILKNIKSVNDAKKIAGSVVPKTNPSLGFNNFYIHKEDEEIQVVQSVVIGDEQATLTCKSIFDEGDPRENYKEIIRTPIDPQGNMIQQAILEHVGTKLLLNGVDTTVPFSEFMTEDGLGASMSGVLKVIKGREDSPNKGAFCLDVLSSQPGNHYIVPNRELNKLILQGLPLEVGVAHMCHSHSAATGHVSRTNCFYHSECRAGCGVLRSLGIEPDDTQGLINKFNITKWDESYTTSDLEYFWTYVQKLNRNRRARLREELTSEISLDKDAAIVLVGSDGKGERQFQSKSDLVFLGMSNFDPDLAKYFYDCLRRQKLMDSIEEYKDLSKGIYLLDGEIPLSYVTGNKSAVYPDYLLHSRMICGDDKLHNQVRHEVVREMTGNNELGRRIREKMRDQLNLQRGAISQGIYREGVLFDDQFQYYSETQPFSYGFKFPFLRTIQRRLDFTLISIVNDIGIGNFDVANYPTATVDRIKYFIEQGVMDLEQGMHIREAYLWFLQRYHEIQNNYLKAQEPTKLVYDKEKFKYYSELVKQFSFREKK
jgi:hypothetical protein